MKHLLKIQNTHDLKQNSKKQALRNLIHHSDIPSLTEKFNMTKYTASCGSSMHQDHND